MWMPDDQLVEEKLDRTPLELVPHGEVRKVVRKLGGAMALEIMGEVKRVEEKRPRTMNDLNAWSLPFISSRVREHESEKNEYLTQVERWKAIRLKKAEREALFRVWLPTSNIWDDPDETFVIQSFDGFRKRGIDGAKADEFHVIWKPRIFAADEDFPDELPEAQGLPWSESDDLDWMNAKTMLASYKRNKVENAVIIGLLEQLKCGVVDGVVV